MRNQYLSFVLGKESPLGFTLLGAVMVLVGGILLWDLHAWGALLLFTGLILVVAYTGVLIDPQGRKLKYYTWILGWKAGSWQDLGGYQDIIVMRRKRRFGYSYGGYFTVGSRSEIIFEVYLANHNHIKNLLICRKQEEQEAYQLARKIADELACEFVQYNPGRQRPRKLL